MKKYRCSVCDYIYDPTENNQIPFEDLAFDWCCPECGAAKGDFEEVV